jgi:hypothetical protein
LDEAVVHSWTACSYLCRCRPARPSYFRFTPAALIGAIPNPSTLKLDECRPSSYSAPFSLCADSATLSSLFGIIWFSFSYNYWKCSGFVFLCLILYFDLMMYLSVLFQFQPFPQLFPLCLSQVDSTLLESSFHWMDCCFGFNRVLQ